MKIFTPEEIVHVGFEIPECKYELGLGYLRQRIRGELKDPVDKELVLNQLCNSFSALYWIAKGDFSKDILNLIGDYLKVEKRFKFAGFGIDWDVTKWVNFFVGEDRNYLGGKECGK